MQRQKEAYHLPFDFNEAKSSNTLITGTNRTGKTRLACGIASMLQLANWKIVVFDNSGVWKSISDLPYLIDVKPKRYFYEIPILRESVIYNISNLIPEQQKQFVDFVLLDLWNHRTTFNVQWVLVVLEEFELYGRSTRGRTAQNLFRIMHVGRNKQIRVLAISTDLALIDPSFIRLCSQRYHSRMGIEENSKRKFKAYYGKEVLQTTLNLQLGQFLYLNKNHLEVIKVPLFQTENKPVRYQEPQRRKGFWKRILGR